MWSIPSLLPGLFFLLWCWGESYPSARVAVGYILDLATKVDIILIIKLLLIMKIVFDFINPKRMRLSPLVSIAYPNASKYMDF